MEWKELSRLSRGSIPDRVACCPDSGVSWFYSGPQGNVKVIPRLRYGRSFQLWEVLANAVTVNPVVG
jgi:hypothetical protein